VLGLRREQRRHLRHPPLPQALVLQVRVDDAHPVRPPEDVAGDGHAPSQPGLGAAPRPVERHRQRDDARGLDRPEADLTRADSLDPAVEAARPDLIIHCAAMTDVDGAARDPALAYRINGLGTQNLALAAARVGAAVAYISTNEVFDGAKGEPYFEFDATRAINPYGQSKLAGEWFVSHLLQRFYIIRIAWLTAPGGRNFVHRIIQLAEAQGALRVVTDEVANSGARKTRVSPVAGLKRTTLPRPR